MTPKMKSAQRKEQQQVLKIFRNIGNIKNIRKRQTDTIIARTMGALPAEAAAAVTKTKQIKHEISEAIPSSNHLKALCTNSYRKTVKDKSTERGIYLREKNPQKPQSLIR